MVGLLAVPGVVLAWRGRQPVERFAAVWLLVLAPIGLLGELAGDLGLVTPRRVFFLASIPLVICAAIATTAWLRRGPIALVLTIVVAAVVVPSVAEAMWTRDHVDEVWAPEPADGPYASRLWSPALDRLRDAMYDRGSVTVVAPDNDGLFVWEHSGAQPFGFLPTGSVKLGFDPARTTDYGYLERVRLVERAQGRGLPGLCGLARRTGADFLVLRRDGDLLGTHDTRPSARYRVEPEDRTAAAIDRRVGPGLRYLDTSSNELLEIAPGRSAPLGWHDPAVRRIDVYQDRKRPIPPMYLVLPGGRRVEPRIVATGPGVDPALRDARRRTRRHPTRCEPARPRPGVAVIGYTPARDLPGPTTGVVVLDPATVC